MRGKNALAADRTYSTQGLIHSRSSMVFSPFRFILILFADVFSSRPSSSLGSFLSGEIRDFFAFRISSVFALPLSSTIFYRYIIKTNVQRSLM